MTQRPPEWNGKKDAMWRSNYRLPEEPAQIKGIACPHCGQDWIRSYRRKDSDSIFFMRPECESLWLHEGDLEEETELYLSDYMHQYDASSIWDNIEDSN